MAPIIAIVSFPGNNCEVESLRAIERAGMSAVFVKWNDPIREMGNFDGYFIPGGFSYEDRGRAGMVAARDPLLAHIASEAQKGKVVIGNCNGAQVLVESGLIPLDTGLSMSLAHNVIDGKGVGFLNEWVWITPQCDENRCATSHWKGVMHVPIAHGEGRFTTEDRDVIDHLKSNNQIAFSYCDKDGVVSDSSIVTPNGSLFAIAGICNPAGNVVALMPHPERTPIGDPYFVSMKRWIENKMSWSGSVLQKTYTWNIASREADGTEIFIDTIIVNNEERTVEQAAKRVTPGIAIRQLKYFSIGQQKINTILGHTTFFNPNKERAFIRRNGAFYEWDADAKIERNTESLFENHLVFLRKEIPDTGADAIGGGETGVCYVCSGLRDEDANRTALLEIFANPHASILQRMN